MDENSATGLIGKRVSAWTAAQGVYLGYLQEVVAVKGRPWRGVVRIDGIAQPAQHSEMDKACRRGFRVGETIEVGGVNISETDVVCETDYAQILERSIANCQEQLSRMADSRHAWAQHEFIKGYKAALSCEKRRLETGEWDHRFLAEEYRRINDECRREGRLS